MEFAGGLALTVGSGKELEASSWGLARNSLFSARTSPAASLRVAANQHGNDYCGAVTQRTGELTDGLCAAWQPWPKCFQLHGSACGMKHVGKQTDMTACGVYPLSHKAENEGFFVGNFYCTISVVPLPFTSIFFFLKFTNIANGENTPSDPKRRPDSRTDSTNLTLADETRKSSINPKMTITWTPPAS